MAGGANFCKECGKIDRADATVASHFNTGNLIISNNKGDFPSSGGFEGMILTADEMMGRG